MKTITVITIIMIITVILPRLGSRAAALEATDSGSYKFRWNMTSGTPGESDSSGYKVKVGSPDVEIMVPFSFTISDLSIDFGVLTPGAFPSPLPTNALTVSSGDAGGYSVTVFQDKPLTLQTGTVTIPDTTCNSGTCSQTTAGVWTDTTKYGFGYNLSGNDVPTAFANSTYFKQFADASQSEAAQVVMSSPNVGVNRIATITYQINVPSTQTAGDYENSIVFIATPTY